MAKSAATPMLDEPAQLPAGKVRPKQISLFGDDEAAN